MRVFLVVCLALVAIPVEASIVTRTFHFQFADGNFYVTSESGIDYGGLFASGIDFSLEYDDAGVFYTVYDRETPPVAIGTVDASPNVPVLSDALISHNVLSLVDTTGFTASDGTLGNSTYSFFQQIAIGSHHSWIQNTLTNYVNFESNGAGVHRATFAFYWLKDGVEYSDRIIGVGYPDDIPSVVPESQSLLAWSLLTALGCCLTMGRRRWSPRRQ